VGGNKPSEISLTGLWPVLSMDRVILRFAILCAAFFLWAGLASTARAETPDSSKGIEFFETKVRPVLAEHCIKCHGPDKQRGSLRLDSPEAVLTGGESGPALEPGHPEDSLMISAINYDGLKMPPTGQLDAQSIAVLTEWVRLGAPWPSGGDHGPQIRPRGGKITEQDRAYWAFQPLANVEPPPTADPWIRTPLDAFILARLHEAGLQPAPPAEKTGLVRRAYFDLWGLPPTPEEIAEFVSDNRPDAFAQLVDRLLEHPNYGRHWARHWLDLVRYAESDGYKADGYRPNAWRYRDYVIDAFDSDKPYDRFVREQLAGDEIAPQDLNARTATAYLRHTIYEYNQRDARGQWDLMVNELTDVTADVFLGVGLSCARCHDHKFDPILQKDYYRFRAFFESVLPRDDIPYATADQIAVYQQQYQLWEEKTRDIRARLDYLEKPIRQRAINGAINKFPLDVRPMIRTAANERSPQQEQIAQLANRQIVLETDKLDYAAQLSDEDKVAWRALRDELATFDHLKPAPLEMLFSVTDVGPVAPSTHIPNGDELEMIEPGILSVLDPNPALIEPPANLPSTGRRTALANWIANPNNPLSTRIIVNRVWQYHFGEGLVASSSDFGRLGEPPSHPELLDWLTRDFVTNGWSLKRLHRLIMNSATYQQSSHGADDQRGIIADPRNRFLWHMPVRRLDAEQIRDALLLVSGELRERSGGPGDESTAPVRSIYTRIMRNARDPLLDAFDAPDAFGSLARRNTTTTPTQSLLMLNSDLTLQRAKALANVVHQYQQDSNDPTAAVQFAYRRVLGRLPTNDESELAKNFLTQQQRLIESEQPSTTAAPGTSTTSSSIDLDTWVDFCHVLLNSSEFIYVE